MRSAALPLVGLLLLSSAAGAQLTLLPQIGIDNSQTSLRYNGGKSFAPLGRQTDPRASLRLDYRFKGGHGPFLGVASSPAPVDYSFADPLSGATQYRATNADRQWRLEGGWQYSTKPITFRNRKAEAAAAQRARTREAERSASKSRCGSYKSSSPHDQMAKAIQKVRSKAWNLRVQPFAGAAYIPSVKEDFSTQSGTNTYKAGNWNTALLAGTGLEFGRGQRRLFTISVQYSKGLGNLGEKTLVTESDAKTTLTRLQSDVSAWSVGLGLPFTLSKKKAVSASRTESTKERSKCGGYKEYRCTRKVVI